LIKLSVNITGEPQTFTGCQQFMHAVQKFYRKKLQKYSQKAESRDTAYQLSDMKFITYVA